MEKVRVISDVPQDKLRQVVTDLEYEFGKESIRVSLQPNNLWKVEYISEATPERSSQESRVPSRPFFK